jgi:hypothetical protein
MMPAKRTNMKSEPFFMTFIVKYAEFTCYYFDCGAESKAIPSERRGLAALWRNEGRRGARLGARSPLACPSSAQRLAAIPARMHRRASALPGSSVLMRSDMGSERVIFQVHPLCQFVVVRDNEFLGKVLKFNIPRALPIQSRILAASSLTTRRGWL